MGGRKQAQKDIKPGIYILGEGKTEQYYFTHLKTLLGFQYIVKPRFCRNSSIDEICRRIKDLINDYVFIICVIDLDVINRDSKEKLKYEKLIHKYSNNEKKILFCTSLPSIEYWFLLHYKFTNKYFKDSDEVANELKKYIKDYEKKEEYLKKTKWVEELLKDNKLETAIERAKQNIDKSGSYTNIYEGIEKVSLLNQIRDKL